MQNNCLQETLRLGFLQTEYDLWQAPLSMGFTPDSEASAFLDSAYNELKKHDSNIWDYKEYLTKKEKQ
ncbi:hypothetical protein UFOVP954_39 [uncultured Caudovirales phage]|nr:hypothetical protein UFOVP954_39 [uncultured Caudovirales phage]